MKLKIIIRTIIVIFSLLISILFLKSSNETHDAECKNCSVILFTVDVLRVENLGIYEYPRNTSPNIDSFFKQGFIFYNAFSTSSHTLPSHVSIFTGNYPSTHKIMPRANMTLPHDQKTIAEIFKVYGYQTQSFHGDDSLDTKGAGFERGFDNVYNQSDNKPKIFDFLKSVKGKFFLSIYTEKLHDPYLSNITYENMFDKDYNVSIIGDYDKFVQLKKENNITDDFTQERLLFWSKVNKSDTKDVKHLIALYDSNIYQIDLFFGELIKYLDDRGFLNDTIIILTSDHGEQFNEHGDFLHTKLYDEIIHVPLLIYVPKTKQTVIKNQVSLVDLSPTILSLVGIVPPQNIDGRSLKFLMGNPNVEDKNQVIYSEFAFQRAIRTTEWKFIKTVNGTVSYEFFDLRNDPKELINLYGKNVN